MIREPHYVLPMEPIGKAFMTGLIVVLVGCTSYIFARLLIHGAHAILKQLRGGSFSTDKKTEAYETTGIVLYIGMTVVLVITGIGYITLMHI